MTQNRRNLLIFSLISFVSVFIISISWFKSGDIITNSEEALSIYHPFKMYETNSTSWYQNEMGFLNPYGINRAYVFLLLSFLSQLGIPAFILQALLIGIAMFFALIFCYLLFNFLSHENFLISSFGSFLYVFNLYTQSQIYRRMLYNYMYALAYYPLFLFLLIKLLNSGSWKTLGVFLLSSVIFSFSFNQPATLMLFLISGVIVTITRLWQLRKDLKRLLNTLLFAFLTLGLFALVNIWWLYPITKGSGDYVSTLPANLTIGDANLDSLKAVSKSFPIQEILLLRQSWWYGPDQHWFSFYSSPLIYLLSIGVLALAILGLVKSYKNRFWPTLLILLGIGLFLSKGANPPFGTAFFSFLFKHFFYSAALRNPYEKVGMIFVLPFAYFFGVGVYFLVNKLKGDFLRKSLAILFGLMIIILVWPVWSGNVFRKDEQVAVPSYYSDANTFLNTQPETRIFHIPVTKYYNEKYDWGYYGQDPSENLFDHPSLSNPYLLGLGSLFSSSVKPTDKNFASFLGFLGVGNIIDHHDSSNKSENNLVQSSDLNTWDKVNKVYETGKLTIYQIDPALIRSRFYAIQLEDKSDATEYVSKTFPSLDILNEKFTNLAFDKLGPTHFLVHVTNAKSPFILIFNDTFDKSWISRINLENQQHSRAYGIVNGWIIEKSGNFDVTVKLKVWPWD